MPRKLQDLSNQQLLIAINVGHQRMGEVPPADVVFSTSTVSRINSDRQPWIDANDLEDVTFGNQTTATKLFNKELKKLEWLNSGLVQALDGTIEIGITESSVRPWYNLVEEHGGVPNMDSQENKIFWADKLVKGENKRILEGGTAFGYPFSGAAITAQLIVVQNAKTASVNADKAHDDAQKAVADMRKDKIEPLQTRMWAEAEAAYSEETKPSQRANARRWGVVYIPSPGEMGVIMELFGINNLPIAGHFVVSDGFEGDINATGVRHITEDDGLVAGDYTVTFSSPTYQDQTVPVTIEPGKTTEVTVTLVKIP